MICEWDRTFLERFFRGILPGNIEELFWLLFIVACDVRRRGSQLKILGGAPKDFRGERWATGDYSGRIGEEAHSPICPLKPPDKIITGDLWWELLRGPQWSHRRLEGRNLRWAAIEIKRTFRRRPHGGPPVMRLSTPPLPTIFPLSAPDYFQ